MDRNIRMTGLAALTAAAFALAVPATGARAADLNPAPAPEGKQEKLTPQEMEARMKALEQRVAELEAALKDRGPAVGFGGARRGGARERDFDALREQLRQMVPNMDDAFPQFGPNFGGPDMGFDMPGQRKPRLGVNLAEVTDELKTRFRAEVDQGAFVMSVVPGSPAERANLAVGDAIVQFNGKPVTEPADLIDAVRAAPEGKQTITVNRKGTKLEINVELGADQLTAAPQPAPDGWLRRDGMARDGMARGGGANVQQRTQIRASALEMNDALAKDLNLKPEQRDKMSAILDKHAKALSEEANNAPQNRRGGFSGNLNRMAEKHADDAAAELKDVLTPDQLAKWERHRATHQSISITQSTVKEFGGGEPLPNNDKF